MIGSATNCDFPILLVDVFLYFAIEFLVEDKKISPLRHSSVGGEMCFLFGT